VGYRFAGLQDQQVVAGHEGGWRAGHGLDGHRLAAQARPNESVVNSSSQRWPCPAR
jgi:hypothetical protein